MENENTVDIQDETKEEAVETTEEVNLDDINLDVDDTERLKSENAKLKRLLAKKDKPREERKEVSTHPDIQLELQKIRLESKGYSDKQIDMLMKMGGIDALKSEDIKIAIDAIGEREKQAKAQAESTVQSKSERKYGEEQLRNMSSADILKLYQEGKLK